VSRRPVAVVSALTLGDYMLWNWALGAGHDVLALAAGLTLLPLGAACLLMLALTLVPVLARSSQRSAALAGSLASSVISSRRRRRLALAERRVAPARRHRGLEDAERAAAQAAERSSHKLAA
jgi:hypothetical protein